MSLAIDTPVERTRLNRPRLDSEKLRQTTRLHLKRAERRHYLAVYWVAFVFFLAIAVFARLFPKSWRPHPLGSGDYGSVFGEAKAVANMTIPYAFRV